MWTDHLDNLWKSTHDEPEPDPFEEKAPKKSTTPVVDKYIQKCIKNTPGSIHGSTLDRIKDLLLSDNNDDDLGWALKLVLRGNEKEESYTVNEAIRVLVKNREKLSTALIGKKKEEPKVEVPKPEPAKPVEPEYNVKREVSLLQTAAGANVALARSQKCTFYETVNGSFFDVEPTNLKKPEVSHIPLTQFPDWARASFHRCKELNDIQSIVYETAFATKENMLICAPTGAGKTNTALMTILNILADHLIIKPNQQAVLDKRPFLIVYITPMKALATEITDKLQMALKHLGIVVREYTGDTHLAQLELEQSHLLVATPEKWDIATRRTGENTPATRLELLIIDEIHLLHDDRGPVIEALVARTLRQAEQTQRPIRIVGLSATLPNAKDVGDFLRVNEKGLFVFGPEFRPVPLGMTIVGSKNTTNTPTLEDEEIFRESYSVIHEKDLAQIDVLAVNMLKGILSRGEQVIVFVHSRGDTYRFGQLVSTYCSTHSSSELLNSISKRNLNPQLAECLARGIGIHHAGLPRNDRIFVENTFRQNGFQILVCTATLAWGVNLPAHTCMIKGTQVYNHERGGFENIGILDVHQMFGRAGRPQYDTSGHAILVTTGDVLQNYTQALINSDPIESRFSGKLEDFLNAEICLGTVTSNSDAMTWLRYTYLHVRNPDEKVLLRRLETAIRNLSDNFMIRTSLNSEDLQATHLGQVASIHYIPVRAVHDFQVGLVGDMNEAELLDCVFQSTIFDPLIVRKSERNDLEHFKKIIPVLSPLETTPGKVNILFQSVITRTQLSTPSLILDQSWMLDNLPRIFNGIFELAIERGWCYLANFALDVCKMVFHQISWVEKHSDHPLRQIMPGFKYNQLFYKLDSFGISVNDLKTMSFDEVAKSLRSEQMAGDAINGARRFPAVAIGCRYQPVSETVIKIIVECVFPFEWDNSRNREEFWLFIEDADGQTMYSAETISVDSRMARDGVKLDFLVPLSLSRRYVVNITSDTYLGVGNSQQITISHGDRLTYTQIETPLFAIRPLQTSIVGDKAKLFNFNEFNPIQTQLFFQCYHSRNSMLICAPSDAGKSGLAQICSLKARRTAYICTRSTSVDEIMANWSKMKPYRLTGNFQTDCVGITTTSIVCGCVKDWNMVTRSSIIQPYIDAFDLVVCDELHLLDSKWGGLMEGVILRFLNKSPRVIGLSNTIVNPMDVANFLQITNKEDVYCFTEEARTVPIKLEVRGFPGRQYSSRVAAMNKPLSEAIKDHARARPTIIYTSTAKQAKLTATDLLMYANNRHAKDFYVTEEARAAAKKVEDPEMSKYLTQGIGVYSSPFPHDIQILERLFEEGNLKLLIAPYTQSWGRKIKGYYVIIKGTEKFNYETGQFEAYSMNELRQMIDRAGIMGDTEGHVLVCCEDTKANYIKQFLESGFPVESQLQRHLTEMANVEIAAGRVRNKSAGENWIRSTYFGIRLAKNQKYYNNVSEKEVIENILELLFKAKCLDTRKATSLDRLAVLYNVTPGTVHLFNKRINEAQQMPNLMKLMCDAEEMNDIKLSFGEEEKLRRLKTRIKMDKFDSHGKAFVLLQLYLSKRDCGPDLQKDQKLVIERVTRVASLFVHIVPTIKMKLNVVALIQAVKSGMWWDENPLLSFFNQKQIGKNRLRTLPEILIKKDAPPELEAVKEQVTLYRPAHLAMNQKEVKIGLERVTGIRGCRYQFLIGDPEKGTVFAQKQISLKTQTVDVILKGQCKPGSWIYMLPLDVLGIDQMIPIGRVQLERLNFEDDIKEFTEQMLSLNKKKPKKVPLMIIPDHGPPLPAHRQQQQQVLAGKAPKTKYRGAPEGEIKEANFSMRKPVGGAPIEEVHDPNKVRYRTSGDLPPNPRPLQQPPPGARVGPPPPGVRVGPPPPGVRVGPPPQQANLQQRQQMMYLQQQRAIQAQQQQQMLYMQQQRAIQVQQQQQKLPGAVDPAAYMTAGGGAAPRMRQARFAPNDDPTESYQQWDIPVPQKPLRMENDRSH